MLCLQIIHHRGSWSVTVREGWHRKTEGKGKEVKWMRVLSSSLSASQEPMASFSEDGRSMSQIQHRALNKWHNTECGYDLKEPLGSLYNQPYSTDCKAIQPSHFWRDFVCVRLMTSSAVQDAELRWEKGWGGKSCNCYSAAQAAMVLAHCQASTWETVIPRYNKDKKPKILWIMN